MINLMVKSVLAVPSLTTTKKIRDSIESMPDRSIIQAKESGFKIEQDGAGSVAAVFKLRKGEEIK